MQIQVRIGECDKPSAFEAKPDSLPGCIYTASLCESKKFCHLGGRDYEHNYGLLLLNRTLTFNDNIQPVCLPDRNPPETFENCGADTSSIPRQDSKKLPLWEQNIKISTHYDIAARTCTNEDASGCNLLWNASFCVPHKKFFRKTLRGSLICSDSDTKRHTVHGLFAHRCRRPKNHVVTNLDNYAADIKELMTTCEANTVLTRTRECRK